MNKTSENILVKFHALKEIGKDIGKMLNIFNTAYNEAHNFYNALADELIYMLPDAYIYKPHYNGERILILMYSENGTSQILTEDTINILLANRCPFMEKKEFNISPIKKIASV